MSISHRSLYPLLSYDQLPPENEETQISPVLAMAMVTRLSEQYNTIYLNRSHGTGARIQHRLLLDVLGQLCRRSITATPRTTRQLPVSLLLSELFFLRRLALTAAPSTKGIATLRACFPLFSSLLPHRSTIHLPLRVSARRPSLPPLLGRVLPPAILVSVCWMYGMRQMGVQTAEQNHVDVDHALSFQSSSHNARFGGNYGSLPGGFIPNDWELEAEAEAESVAVQKEASSAKQRIEHPCWFYSLDSKRYSDCKWYCSKNRYRYFEWSREHLEQHWTWGDFKAHGLDEETYWRAYDAVKRFDGRTDTRSKQHRAISIWRTISRILFPHSPITSHPKCHTHDETHKPTGKRPCPVPVPVPIPRQRRSPNTTRRKPSKKRTLARTGSTRSTNSNLPITAHTDDRSRDSQPHRIKIMTEQLLEIEAMIPRLGGERSAFGQAFETMLLGFETSVNMLRQRVTSTPTPDTSGAPVPRRPFLEQPSLYASGQTSLILNQPLDAEEFIVQTGTGVSFDTTPDLSADILSTAQGGPQRPMGRIQMMPDTSSSTTNNMRSNPTYSDPMRLAIPRQSVSTRTPTSRSYDSGDNLIRTPLTPLTNSMNFQSFEAPGDEDWRSLCETSTPSALMEMLFGLNSDVDVPHENY